LIDRYNLIFNWQNAISYKQAKIYSSDNSTNDKEKERKNDENNSSEAKLM